MKTVVTVILVVLLAFVCLPQLFNYAMQIFSAPSFDVAFRWFCRALPVILVSALIVFGLKKSMSK